MVLNKKNLFLMIVLPLLFISDVFYGLMVYYGIGFAITPGIVLRGLLLIIAISFIIIRVRSVERKEINWLLALIILAIPGLFIGLVVSESYSYDISSSAKVLYLPILCVFFMICFTRFKISSDQVLSAIEFSAYFLGISLLLSQILGVNRETYGSYAFGTTGVFHAQNDLTLAFGLSLISAAYRLVFVRFSLLRLLFLVLSLVACLKIGTNSSLIIPIIVIFVLFSIHLTSKSSYSFSIYIIKFVLFSLLGFVFLYFFSNTVETFLAHDYQAKKVEALLSGEFSRAPLTYAAEQHISKRILVFDLFGEGFDSFHRGVAQYFTGLVDRRIVESDPYDIYGAHGILFLFAIYFYLVRFFKESVINFFRSNRNPNYILTASAIFLYFFYSLLVGHALTSPIPSTLLAAYIGLFYAFKKSEVG
jgi:hypothetical protein